MLPKPVDLLGVAFGRGARDAGCGDAPDFLRRERLIERHLDRRADVRWRAVLPDRSDLPPIEAAARLFREVAGIVEEAVERGRRMAVIGGDHSCAIGTWSGAARALRRRGPLGLLWIDAHLDAHTPETSHSGTLHGMPVAALLGHGDPRLAGISGSLPAVLPEHVCLVGARDFEPEEPAFLSCAGVRVFYMEEVARRGLSDVLDEAMAVVRDGTAGFGLSLDVDAVDPEWAPGVGSPVPGGLDPAALGDGIAQIRATAEPLLTELVELNPHRDEAGRTARLAADLLTAALG